MCSNRVSFARGCQLLSEPQSLGSKLRGLDLDLEDILLSDPRVDFVTPLDDACDQVKLLQILRRDLDGLLNEIELVVGPLHVRD